MWQHGFPWGHCQHSGLVYSLLDETKSHADTPLAAGLGHIHHRGRV